jgi:hypothetical protein
MLPKVFVGFGILLMVYAVYSVRKLLSVVREADNRRPWYILFPLIIFFLFGYLFYFYLLFTSISPSDMSAQLISAIFFFGAVFVVIVLSVNYALIGGLNEKAAKIQETNTALLRNTEIVQKKDNELEEAKITLERKNKELERALEDFYTLRLSMQRDMDEGKLQEENRKIKEKLDELKITS